MQTQKHRCSLNILSWQLIDNNPWEKTIYETAYSDWVTLDSVHTNEQNIISPYLLGTLSFQNSEVYFNYFKLFWAETLISHSNFVCIFFPKNILFFIDVKYFYVNNIL